MVEGRGAGEGGGIVGTYMSGYRDIEQDPGYYKEYSNNSGYGTGKPRSIQQVEVSKRAEWPFWHLLACRSCIYLRMAEMTLLAVFQLLYCSRRQSPYNTVLGGKVPTTLSWEAKVPFGLFWEAKVPFWTVLGGRIAH